MRVCLCVWASVFDIVCRLSGVFAFYAVLFAFLFVLSRAFCVFSLAHYLVYLSLLMTFKWHLLSPGRGVGRTKRVGARVGRAMNGNRKATHTHTRALTHHSISRAAKFVESCGQATELSNSICAQTSHWFNILSWRGKENFDSKPNTHLATRAALQLSELISIFGGKNRKNKSNPKPKPLEKSSTALEKLAHYLWRFPSKTQSTIASSAVISKLQLKHLPVIHTETDRPTGLYILYRCLCVEHDDNDLATRWECECEWMGAKTADFRVPIWV